MSFSSIASRTSMEIFSTGMFKSILYFLHSGEELLSSLMTETVVDRNSLQWKLLVAETVLVQFSTASSSDDV